MTDRRREYRRYRNTVRFRITTAGTPKIARLRRRRRYEELLADLPHAQGTLETEADGERNGWVITGRVPEDLAQEARQDADVVLAGGQVFESDEAAGRYLRDHEQALRTELADSFFTMGTCRGCGEGVPVLGQYVQYDPAGVLRCADCNTDENGESAGATLGR